MAEQLPKHGRMACRKCFSGTENILTTGSWRIRNDPGAWGSPNPKYLVLGFSKGATQADIYANGLFDNVAFGGSQTRANLSRVLQTVGLLRPGEQVDSRIHAGEKEFHFASLVRCSLARCGKDGEFKTSGELIKKSFKEVPSIISACASEYLAELPKSVELVLMLGTDDGYIKEVKSVMQRLHRSTFKDVGPVSFIAGGVPWVHITHPSKGNGHLSAWLKGDEENSSGRKQKIAVREISSVINRGVRV